MNNCLSDLNNSFPDSKQDQYNRVISESQASCLIKKHMREFSCSLPEYFCGENFMNGGVWRPTSHGGSKESDMTEHACTFPLFSKGREVIKKCLMGAGVHSSLLSHCFNPPQSCNIACVKANYLNSSFIKGVLFLTDFCIFGIYNNKECIERRFLQTSLNGWKERRKRERRKEEWRKGWGKGRLD